MAQCFSVCGCGDFEGVSRSDLDRFTDKIDNVLNDERGRRIFRGFMITAKLKDGKKCLNFWEKCEAAINSQAAESSDKSIYREFLSEVDDLIEEADRIEDLDFAIMEKVTIARDSEIKEEIMAMLKLLKLDVTKAMRVEYQRFREHFTRSQY